MPLLSENQPNSRRHEPAARDCATTTSMTGDRCHGVAEGGWQSRRRCQGADERGETLARIGSSVQGRMEVELILVEYKHRSIALHKHRHHRSTQHNQHQIMETCSTKNRHHRFTQHRRFARKRARAVKKRAPHQQAPKKAHKQQLYLHFRENSLPILPTSPSARLGDRSINEFEIPLDDRHQPCTAFSAGPAADASRESHRKGQFRFFHPASCNVIMQTHYADKLLMSSCRHIMQTNRYVGAPTHTRSPANCLHPGRTDYVALD